MMKFVAKIRHYFEKNGFAVCTRFAEKLGIRVATVRLFFVYLSFFTLGLGFTFYLTLAFILKLKDLVYSKRSSVFDL
jgi:phage shock protein PspC (stress-responsive transcriptional regulator)